jgi:PBSX family phage terminase large subunit
MTTELKLLKHQYDFLEDEESRYLALVAGYGAGKTHAFCYKTLFLAARNIGYSGAIMEPTYGMIKRVLLPKMFELLDEIGVKYSFAKSDSIFTFHFAEGDTTVYCLSAENYTRMAGMNLAFFGVDECDTINKETARAMWNMAISRLRSGVVYQGFTTSTPEGFKFLYEYFYDEPKNDPKIVDRRLIKGKTKDNPNLPPDFIQSLLDNYPPQLIKAYLDGEFVNLNSGSVYPNFDREKNHTDLSLKDFPGYPLHIGQDFNMGKCSSVVHVLHNGNPVAVDEITGALNTEAVINIIKERYGNRHITVYPDASGANNKTSASMSDLTLLQRAGFKLSYSAKNPPVKDRVNAMNAMLCNNNGERRYLINTKICKEYTRCLEQQVYDASGQPDKSAKSNVDHMLDAAGYFINMQFPIVGRPTARIY